MARPAKIWWNASKGKFYATIQGRKVPLSADRQEAEQLFYRHKCREQAPDLRDCNACRTIIDLYVDYLRDQQSKSHGDADWFLQTFVARHPDLRVRDLRAVHVHQWINNQPTWNESTRRNAIGWLLTALNWAVRPEQGLIDRNPVAGIKRPAMRSRGQEAVISPEDHQKMYQAANPRLQEVMFILSQTGTRPGNVCQMTAAMCDFDNGIIVIDQHKTLRKTGCPLYIPMTTPAAELLRRLCAQHKTGLLFRNNWGLPWTPRHIAAAFVQLRLRCRITARVMPYGYRHTVATELLRAGESEARIMQILGHTTPSMLHKHYGHLDRYRGESRAALDRVLNPAQANAAQAEPVENGNPAESPPPVEKRKTAEDAAWETWG